MAVAFLGVARMTLDPPRVSGLKAILAGTAASGCWPYDGDRCDAQPGSRLKMQACLPSRRPSGPRSPAVFSSDQVSQIPPATPLVWVCIQADRVVGRRNQPDLLAGPAGARPGV
jgi:hypothetical protein